MTKSAAIMRTACPVRNQYQGTAPRVLFVCTMGLLRSATMATMAAVRGINARTCGVNESALVPISENLVMWADAIVFADAGHKIEAMRMFPDWAAVRNGLVWSVPDVYDYMNPTLVRLLEPKFADLPGMSAHQITSTATFPEDCNAG